MCMSDEWFTEHVFQVVTPRNFVDKKLVDLFENGTASVLPRWVSLSASQSHSHESLFVSRSLTVLPSHRTPWELSLVPKRDYLSSFLARCSLVDLQYLYRSACRMPFSRRLQIQYPVISTRAFEPSSNSSTVFLSHRSSRGRSDLAQRKLWSAVFPPFGVIQTRARATQTPLPERVLLFLFFSLVRNSLGLRASRNVGNL